MATVSSLLPPTLRRKEQLFSALATFLLLVTTPRPSHSFPLTPEFSASAPALAPEAMPVLPRPGGSAGKPPVSSLPIIPSSPSPPNPDEMQPNSAVAPSGSTALTSAAAHCGWSSGGVGMAVACGMVLVWWFGFDS
ncbi:hypothetical protein OPV22_000195 [Ensete ventricosum]|uniref:Uncharacterized protein n=1 Tax=Ensete ventricosum TaxID=4639 RepID=A0AAV8QFL5_ENSVE|nr:hypothetical protein OPV22_000195 [Ensete ventricosum]